jgi:hypothetical protein
LQTSVKGQLTTDVAWQTMVKRIAANLPAGVTLTSFSGQVTPPAPVVAVPTPTASTDTSTGTSSGTSSTEPTTTTVPVPAAPVLAGTITFAGSAKDYPTLATWIDDMGKVPEISDVYVTSAQEAGDTGSAKKVTFSAVAVVAPGAMSQRIQQYTKAGS